MLQILFSWLWIGVSAFLCGFAALQLIKKVSGYGEKSVDVILMMGLCFLTVYAQTFSLFYKVGAAASIALFAVDILIFFIWRRRIIHQIVEWVSMPRLLFILIPLALVVGMSLILSATEIQHYDTYLYHAQSIRWIEDYGIVPGLGNLHNRLAYNSSIFSLQALFSLKFLLGKSLHSVNGFVVALLAGYTVCTFKAFGKKKFFASDFMRLTMLIYLFERQNCCMISSPGSDTLALGLVVYILIKWTEYWENGEKRNAPYAVLCLLGVFAVTVKLSAGMIVLLTVLPATRLIAQKSWKQIAAYIVLGTVIIAPFLTRNVLISGYLLYPYPELDLFRVDWKMPKYTLLFDRNEIKAWGWGLKDVYRSNAPMAEWLPVWLESLGSIMRKMFYINLALIVPSAAWGIFKGTAKKDWGFLLIVATVISCFGLWFVGSPLPRYGSVFLILLPLLMLGQIVASIQKNRLPNGLVSLVMLVCVLCCLKPLVQYVLTTDFAELRSPDYAWRDANETLLGDEVIYYPVSGDQMGYYNFPSTPYVARLQLIELRGTELSDGFRMKDAYRDALVTTYGQVQEKNIFE